MVRAVSYHASLLGYGHDLRAKPAYITQNGSFAPRVVFGVILSHFAEADSSAMIHPLQRQVMLTAKKENFLTTVFVSIHNAAVSSGPDESVCMSKLASTPTMHPIT